MTRRRRRAWLAILTITVALITALAFVSSAAGLRDGASAESGPSLASAVRAQFRPPRPLTHHSGDSRDGHRGEPSPWSDGHRQSPPPRSPDGERGLTHPHPPHPRTAIYTYYDPRADGEKDDATRAAERRLLLTWRRAWWAQGFRPMVLGPEQAASSLLHGALDAALRRSGGDPNPALTADLMRWLAWESVGAGLLAQYTLFPMAGRDHLFMASLRRGQERAKLTSWPAGRPGGGDDGLLVGTKAQVAEVLRAALESTQLSTIRSVRESVPEENWRDWGDGDGDGSSALAYYSAHVLDQKYPRVAARLRSSPAAGLGSLAELINAHLHVAWQNSFTAGIHVLRPHPAHTTNLLAGGLALAESLSRCSPSIMPSSCPPNRPRCVPCVAAPDATRMKIATTRVYYNSSAAFTIGTVAHPYTYASLTGLRGDLNVSWVRRETERDPWVNTAMRAVFGQTRGAPAVAFFRDALVGDFSAPRSIWLVAEEAPPPPDLLSWRFGFKLPGRGGGASYDSENGWSQSPVPGRAQRQLEQGLESVPTVDRIPPASELRAEAELLEKATRFLARADEDGMKLRGAIEAWNMADAEAWRLASAAAARDAAEVAEWEAEWRGAVGTEEEDRMRGGAEEDMMGGGGSSRREEG